MFHPYFDLQQPLLHKYALEPTIRFVEILMIRQS